jgi:hypothetical protein
MRRRKNFAVAETRARIRIRHGKQMQMQAKILSRATGDKSFQMKLMKESCGVCSSFADAENFSVHRRAHCQKLVVREWVKKKSNGRI